MQPHLISVHRDRCTACRITATDAAHSDTNIPNSVGLQLVVIILANKIRGNFGEAEEEEVI